MPDPPRRGLQAPGAAPGAPLLPPPPATPPPDTAPPRPRRHPHKKAAARGRAGPLWPVQAVYVSAVCMCCMPEAFRTLDQSYCHRLQHDMYFLTSNSRLNEQVVDKIILQLNRVYPQILTNAEAEKFRNPKASLHTRLSDLIKHLQKKGERHCQEFYRALQINAEQLYDDLPSRKVLSPVFFLACFSVAAGFALFWYCCNSDTKVVARARRILGFSPIIIGRHVRNICMLYLEDRSRN
ncbi:caspase recruitment domain-containing protein 19 isoform 2-T2 [Guaruba guarouba]